MEWTRRQMLNGLALGGVSSGVWLAAKREGVSDHERRNRANSSAQETLDSGDSAPGDTQQSEPMARRITALDVTPAFADPFQISVAVRKEEMLPAETAVLDIELRWDGDENATVLFGHEAPLSSPVYSSPETPGLVLLSEEYVELGVERATDSSWVPAADGELGTPLSATITTFAPGDSISTSYEIWGDPRYVSRVPLGEYEFQETIDNPDYESAEQSSREETPEDTGARNQVTISFEVEQRACPR